MKNIISISEFPICLSLRVMSWWHRRFTWKPQSSLTLRENANEYWLGILHTCSTPCTYEYKRRQVHPLIRFLLQSWLYDKCDDLHNTLLYFIFSWLASRCSKWSPSLQRFPCALQLKEQILKEQITDGSHLFKVQFCPCPLGCSVFLSADNEHDRCLQCLGIQHAEDTFVYDSSAGCGHMSMISLRSRPSFLKRFAPAAATRPGLSGSSRGPPAGALGDLRVTVRASLPGMPHGPFTPHATNVLSGSQVISLIRSTGQPAFHSVCRPKTGCWSQHRGMGLRPLRMKVRRGCPTRVLSLPPYRTQSWRPCLPGHPWVSGWRTTDFQVPSPRGWIIGFSERDTFCSGALLPGGAWGADKVMEGSFYGQSMLICLLRSHYSWWWGYQGIRRHSPVG